MQPLLRLIVLLAVSSATSLNSRPDCRNASAAPAYHGNPDCVDPEAALAAALSGCHMLTFLAVAGSYGWRAAALAHTLGESVESPSLFGIWVSSKISGSAQNVTRVPVRLAGLPFLGSLAVGLP